jgi:mono/diheme cytochrome c family protein
MMWLRRTGFGLLTLLLLGGLAAIIALAWHPAISRAEAPAKSSFDADLIRKGAQLALIGNCNSCHTKEGGAAYADGRAVPTPFGTIYATNITPDPETGIGNWSEAAFLRAMREGVRRDGAHLYPAFPYDHFTKLSAGDVQAIYAFLMTRDPVRAPPPANEITFPFNIRSLIAGWKLLFFRPGEFQPDPTQTAELNRGAYLADGLAHCGACHTPRNALGAEKRDRLFASGEAEGWHAPALNAASPAPTPWTKEQLFTYLRQGFTPEHGVAAGPMQPVTDNLGNVPDDYVEAIATYIAATLVPATADRPAKAGERTASVQRPGQIPAGARETTGRAGAATENTDGAVIYAGACAFCHETTGQRFSSQGIHLAISKVLTLPDPRNLIHVIRDGIGAPAGTPAAFMPGFADALTDQQVAALVRYLRATFTDQPAWSEVEEHVRKAASPRTAAGRPEP